MGRVNIALGIADTASRAAAAPVKAVTGGQGGTILLIVGVLFVGYLFLTRKLQRVLEVIAKPVGDGAAPLIAEPSIKGPQPAGGRPALPPTPSWAIPGSPDYGRPGLGGLKRSRIPDRRRPEESPGAEYRGTVRDAGPEWTPSWAGRYGYGRFF